MMRPDQMHRNSIRDEEIQESADEVLIKSLKAEIDELYNALKKARRVMNYIGTQDAYIDYEDADNVIMQTSKTLDKYKQDKNNDY